MRFYLFICFFFLFNCISSEKDAYDSVVINQSDFSDSSRRTAKEITYLKNISQLEESSFQFINKKIKDMVNTYNKIKKRLIKVESRLNSLLNEKTNLGDSSEEIEDTGKKSLQENEDLQDSMKVESSLLKEKVKDDMNIFQEEAETKDEASNEKPSLEKRELKQNHLENKNSDLEKAKKLFENKSYEEAIAQFKKYRDQNPKGSHYPEATFYIGESFKNLKMLVEAKVFFEEIVKSYPQSLWSVRAKKYLKE